MAASDSPASKLIIVTGANGFVASELTRQLLAAGYMVRGTVRAATLADAQKMAHLTALQAEFSSARLELVAAELLEEGAFDSIVAGAACVMHTASPYTLNVKDPVKDLIEPAVNGTINVLRSCANAGIPQVVLTSSMAAVTDSPRKGHVYTEDDWNTESTETRNPYYASKARAERAAWDFVAERRVRGAPVFALATVNPFLVIGPEMGDGVNTSTRLLAEILDGKHPAILNLSWNFIDVRDVAAAHVRAFERGATGRFIMANAAVHMKDVVAMLRVKYPAAKLPKRNLSCHGGTALARLGSYFQPKGTGQYLRTNLSKVCLLDCSRIKRELGLEFIPIAQSILDTTEDLRTRGKLEVPITEVAPSDHQAAQAAAAAEPPLEPGEGSVDDHE